MISIKLHVSDLNAPVYEMCNRIFAVTLGLMKDCINQSDPSGFNVGDMQASIFYIFIHQDNVLSIK